MRFSNVSKTAAAQPLPDSSRRLTRDPGRGSGHQQGGLDFSDCVVEGQNANDPAMGALIVVKGGGVSFTNTKLNFGMARPSDFTDQKDTALIMVQGGTALLDYTCTNRASATSESVPVVSVSGGHRLRHPRDGHGWQLDRQAAGGAHRRHAGARRVGLGSLTQPA